MALHSSICCCGERPSTVSVSTPAPTCCLSPPMRFMKNSSRFDPTIARNFSRSRRGVRESFASFSTLLLNSNQVNSRLRYKFDSERSAISFPSLASDLASASSPSISSECSVLMATFTLAPGRSPESSAIFKCFIELFALPVGFKIRLRLAQMSIFYVGQVTVGGCLLVDKNSHFSSGL